MRPSTDDLATFVQVADSGAVTAAALRLGLAKSVVSKRIAHLEAALSAKLLHRSARGMTLTDAGALFYRRAAAVLSQLDAMSDEVAARSGDLQGRIRIAAPMSFGMRHLGPIIAGFMQAHPRIEIGIDLDDRYADLQGEGYDLAVRIGRLNDSALKARKLGVSRRALCCSPAYAGRHGLPDSLDGLMAHDCLTYGNVAAAQVWRFASTSDPAAEERSLAPRGRFASNSGEALLDAARGGVGLVILPTFITADALAAGDLVEVHIAGLRPSAGLIQVVYPETAAMPLKVRALIDHLAATLREPFSWDRGSE